MSQIWKYNNVELELDMGDIDTAERYERAFTKMEEAAKKLPKRSEERRVGKAAEDRGIFRNVQGILQDVL